MNDGTSERALFEVQAQVMIYDDAVKQWTHAGSSGEAGLSKVQIYHHTVNNTFRVVARRVQDREVVINSSIVKNMKYSQATPNFHQWRNRQSIYGVIFSSPEDAETFAQHILDIVDSLNAAYQQLSTSSGNRAPPTSAAPKTISRPIQNGYEGSGDLLTNEDYDQRQSGGSQFSAGLRTLVPAAPAAAKQKSGPISKSEAPSPMAPPTAPPTVSSTSVAPSTPSGGGCPPPPPPPPVPAVGRAKKQDGEFGEEEGGGLAAALQGAQLKKVAQSAVDSDQQSSSSSNSGSAAVARASVAGGGSGGGGGGGREGGGGPVDMMSEMAKRLQARKAKTERGGSGGPPGGIGATPSQTDSEPGSCGQIEPPFPKSKAPGFTPVKRLSMNSSGSSPSSGLSNISNASVRTLSSGPALNSSTSSSSDLESLKQEILVEISRELNKIKDEIIDAIKAELNKQ